MGFRGFGAHMNVDVDNLRSGEQYCGVCATAGDLWVRLAGGNGEGYVGQIEGFSHESEHDLALMVTDFLENGSGGGESRWCSSDSDSGVPELGHLADKILLCKRPVDQYEMDLLAVVQSHMLSINELNLCGPNDGQCNASCIRKSLVKLLRVSGYEASICISKWQGSNKVPGGDHEFVDVVVHKGVERSEHLIIDIDFRSHFEIARAVDSYNAMLKGLPVIFVGSWNRLKPLLQIMADAARSSLNQNSMPLPPWRSLAYLQAKWHSISERTSIPDEHDNCTAHFPDHRQCAGHLRRLKSAIQSEIESERLLKPINIDKKWRVRPERLKTSFFKA